MWSMHESRTRGNMLNDVRLANWWVWWIAEGWGRGRWGMKVDWWKHRSCIKQSCRETTAGIEWHQHEPFAWSQSSRRRALCAAIMGPEWSANRINHFNHHDKLILNWAHAFCWWFLFYGVACVLCVVGVYVCADLCSLPLAPPSHGHNHRRKWRSLNIIFTCSRCFFHRWPPIWAHTDPCGPVWAHI